ncbi:MAG: glycosyltransferase family 39 protein [Elusimicrobiota bacterium]
MRKDNIILGIILVVGFFLRVWHLDLMEFKQDEAFACLKATHIANFSEFPLAGLKSSVGIHNPPLFIYLMAVPFIFSRNPLAGAFFVVLMNTITILLTYKLANKLFNKKTALISSSLFAFSPWTVIYSRKIWAQDFLPFFTLVFLLVVLEFLIDNKPKQILWILIFLACLVQIHFSGIAGVFFLILTCWVVKPKFNKKYLFVGLMIVLFLFLPYLVFQYKNNFEDLRNFVQSFSEGIYKENFSVRPVFFYFLTNINCGNFQYLIGNYSEKFYSQLSFFNFVNYLEIILFLAGLIFCICKLFIKDKNKKNFLILVIWLLTPIFLLIFIRIRIYPHYLVIQYPVQFILVAIFLDSLQKFFRKKGTAIIITITFFILCSNVFSIFKFYELIDELGGAPGDYGTSYKFKNQAIRYILTKSQGIPQTVKDITPDKKLSLEYQYLIQYNSRIMFGVAVQKSTKQFFILDTFRFGSSKKTNVFPMRSFGPVYVYTIFD